MKKLFKLKLIAVVLFLRISFLSMGIDISALEKSLESGDEKTKIYSLIKLAEYYKDSLPEKSIEYSLKAEFLAVKQNNASLYCTVYDLLGYGCYKLNDFKNSLKYYEKALLKIPEINDTLVIAKVTYNAACIYRANRKSDLALPLLQSCLKYAATVGNPQYRVNLYEALAETYSDLEKYRQAIPYYKMFFRCKDSLNNAYNVYKSDSVTRLLNQRLQKKNHSDTVKIEKQKTEQIVPGTNQGSSFSLMSIIIISLCVIAYGFILGIVLYRKKEQSKLLAELTQQRSLQPTPELVPNQDLERVKLFYEKSIMAIHSLGKSYVSDQFFVLRQNSLNPTRSFLYYKTINNQILLVTTNGISLSEEHTAAATLLCDRIFSTSNLGSAHDFIAAFQVEWNSLYGTNQTENIEFSACFFSSSDDYSIVTLVGKSLFGFFPDKENHHLEHSSGSQQLAPAERFYVMNFNILDSAQTEDITEARKQIIELLSLTYDFPLGEQFNVLQQHLARNGQSSEPNFDICIVAFHAG